MPSTCACAHCAGAGRPRSCAIALLNRAMVAVLRRDLPLAHVAVRGGCAVGTGGVGAGAAEPVRRRRRSGRCGRAWRAARGHMLYGAVQARRWRGIHRSAYDEAFLQPLVDQARRAMGGADAFERACRRGASQPFARKPAPNCQRGSTPCLTWPEVDWRRMTPGSGVIPCSRSPGSNGGKALPSRCSSTVYLERARLASNVGALRLAAVAAGDVALDDLVLLAVQARGLRVALAVDDDAGACEQRAGRGVPLDDHGTVAALVDGEHQRIGPTARTRSPAAFSTMSGRFGRAARAALLGHTQPATISVAASPIHIDLFCMLPPAGCAGDHAPRPGGRTITARWMPHRAPARGSTGQQHQRGQRVAAVQRVQAPGPDLVERAHQQRTGDLPAGERHRQRASSGVGCRAGVRAPVCRPAMVVTRKCRRRTAPTAPARASERLASGKRCAQGHQPCVRTPTGGDVASPPGSAPPAPPTAGRAAEQPGQPEHQRVGRLLAHWQGGRCRPNRNWRAQHQAPGSACRVAAVAGAAAGGAGAAPAAEAGSCRCTHLAPARPPHQLQPAGWRAGARPATPARR